MGTAPEPSRLRRIAAAGSLAAVAAGTAWAGLHESMFVSLRVGLLAVAGMVGLASAGLLRRSVMSQVLARAVAWVVLLPMGMGALESLSSGRAPDLEVLFFGGASAAALLLARPMLHTPAARAQFGPVGFRRWFLAGAVASAAAGIVTAFAGAEALFFGPTRAAAATLALASALLASAVGAVRMRSWGVLLGVLTSVVTLGAAALAGDVYLSLGLALAALPGLILGAPIVASRLRPVGAGASPSPAPRPARVAALAVPEPPFRARIDAGACDIPAGHVAEPLEAKDPRSAAR
ncbi:MAG TPA: hypothetical protein VF765_10585 [Polyangiaceae bacterium]